MMAEVFQRAGIRRLWLSLFVLVAASLAAGGFLYYHQVKSRIRDEKFQDLAAISGLKAAQVRQWRKQQLANVKWMAACPFSREFMQNYPQRPDARGARTQVEKWLQSAGPQDAHTNTLLLDSDGNILLSRHPHPKPFDPEERNTIAAIISGHHARLCDSFRSPDGPAQIDAMAPVLDKGNRLLGIVVLSRDAGRALYAVIHSLPASRATVQTDLVQKDGGSVVFLNGPPRNSKSIVYRHYPLTRTDLAAVQAVLGRRGMYEGKDYRGRTVLADLSPIPGSDWFIVTKMDMKEILAEAHSRAESIILFVVLFILFAAAATAYGYRLRQARLYKKLYRNEREQREIQEEFKTTLYSIGDAVITTDTRGRVKQMNPEAERLTGWRESEAVGQPVGMVFHIVNEETHHEVESPVNKALREGAVTGLANHTLLVSRDGTERPIADSGAPIRDEGGAVIGVVLIFRDQTGERKMQNALQESEQRFRSTLDNMMEGCQVIGFDWRYLYVNDAAAGHGRKTKEALLGRMITEEYPGIESQPLYKAMRQCMEERVSAHFENEFIYPDGSTGWFDLNIEPVPEGIFILSIDISRRKRAEKELRESEARVRKKLDSILSPEGDISLLELTDIIDTDAVQSLLEDFHKLVNIPIGIVDLSGNILVGVGWQEICTRFHRAYPETARNCFESDLALTTGIAARESRLYKCKNNMWDIVTPIMVGKRHLGNLFSGQFFFDDEPVDYELFQSQAVRYGFNEAEYLAAVNKVPRLSRATVDTANGFFTKLADMISNQGYTNLSLARSLATQESTLRNLKVREEELNAAQSLAHIGSWRVRFADNGEIWSVSDELLRIYGYPPDKRIDRRTVIERIYPDDRERIREIWNAAMRGIGPDEWEQRIILDGRIKWIHVHANFRFDDNGRPVEADGTSQDITERKELEFEREITLRLLDLTNATNDLQQLMEKTTMLLQEWLDCEAVGLRLKEGHDFPYYETRGFPSKFIRAENSLCVTGDDDDLLRDEQDVPVLACMCGNVLSGRFDAQKPFFTERGSFWTNSTTELLGATTDADRQAHTRNRCHGAGYESVALFAIRSGTTTYGLVQLNDHRKGRFTRQIVAVMEHLCDHLANAIALRQSQEELRQSEERFRQLFEAANDAVLVYSLAPDGTPKNFIEVNQVACRELGYTREELLQMSPKDIDLQSGDQIKRKIRSIEAENGAVFESMQIAADGRHIPVEISSHIFTLKGEKMALSVVRNLTERKRAEAERKKLEAQLHQAQKMEAVGRLAGGVAHDFNNMLNVIMGYSEMALSRLNPDDLLYQDVMEISSAAKRSSDLTRQLLAFSRKQVIAPKVIDFNSQLKGMERLLQRIIGEDVDLVFKMAPDLWPARLDPSQVDQVVANLAVNSRDAMPDGGTLILETANTDFDAAYCEAHPEVIPGEYVMLAVSDSGCGMDQETMAHVFEPFYTTKPEGKGTGLGLATVYGISRQNNGFVNIYSEPGQGTTIRLYFPRHRGEKASAPEKERKSVPARGTETILLAEDEDQVRQLAKTIMERMGYRVLVAQTPEEALSLSESHAEVIHLLLTDVIMPNMNGRQLSDKIRTLRPDIRTIYMSGYTADAIARQGVLEPGVHFLQKPFSKDVLLQKIREVLDA